MQGERNTAGQPWCGVAVASNALLICCLATPLSCTSRTAAESKQLASIGEVLHPSSHALTCIAPTTLTERSYASKTS